MRYVSKQVFKLAAAALVGATFTTFFFLSAQTKSLEARIPPSLGALSKVIEAKLKDDPVAYAEALLNVQGYREILSPEMLPSPELSSALIALYLSADARERHPSWVKLLKSLDDDDKVGLLRIAMETSNLEDITGRFFEGVVENGKLPTTPILDAAVSELYPVGKLISKQGIFMGPTEFEKLRQSISTLDNQFEKVAVRERLYRNLLVARSLWNTLALTWLAPPTWSQKDVNELLIRMRSLSERVSRPDKDFLIIAIDERMAAHESKKNPIQKTVRFDSVMAAQKEFATLCNVREASIAADYILQTYVMLDKTQRQKLFNNDLFQGCFVGAKRYYPVSRYDEKNPQTPAAVYLPRPGVTAMTLFLISKSVGIPETGNRFEKKITRSTDEDLFHVWLDASQLLPTELRIAVANEKLCTQKTLKGLCRQLSWKNTDTVGRRDFLSGVEGRSLQPLEREHLIYKTLVDAIYLPSLNQKRLARSIRADDRGRLQGELMRMLGEGAAEQPAFVWYFENRDYLAIK